MNVGLFQVQIFSRQSEKGCFSSSLALSQLFLNPVQLKVEVL